MQHRSTAVASLAFEKALRGESFQVSDLQRGLSDSPSRQTVYRILGQLEADGWIQCEGNTWHPAFKTQLLADVDGDRGDRRGFDLGADDVL